MTKLPRKTLSLRLKELCKDGVLIKKEKLYKLKGSSHFKGYGKTLSKMFVGRPRNNRMMKYLMLIVLLIWSSASGYALATFLRPKETYQEPVLLGNFSMALQVIDAEDLYAWQAVIAFNSSELKVLRVIPGDFMNAQYPFFLNATDVYDGMLLIGCTLHGKVAGQDGNGTLATIVFGYFAENYENPLIIPRKGRFETLLFDSSGSLIPLGNPTNLSLSVVEG